MKREPRKKIEHLPEIPELVFEKPIGGGFFSQVYYGSYNGTIPVAIKVIQRGSEQTVNNEIELLNQLFGLHHIVQLLKVYDTEYRILVFRHIDSIDSNYFFAHISPKRFQRVLKYLVRAIKYAHMKGIVHRDIKLGNILILKHFQDLVLIDWGCGCKVTNDMSPKAGSRTCRSPEMLLGYNDYGYGCDMWALGVFIFYTLCKGSVPWKANSSFDVIVKMAPYFGSSPFFDLSEKYYLNMSSELAEGISSCERKAFSDIIVLGELADSDLMDLMLSLLCIDPEHRLKSNNVLQHRYFSHKY